MSVATMSSAYIIDVTDQSFDKDVIEKSKSTPVVVDFWAEWCGPCRMLGPILERLAAEYDGSFILAKVDVDQNQTLARQFHVQGIPAVKAFFNGRVVGEFTGAQPEPRVRDFLQGLMPSQTDALARQAYECEISNQLLKAEANYREVLEEKSDHYSAMLGLGRVLLKQGKIDVGVELLQQIPDGIPEQPAAEALIATAQFSSEAVDQNEAELRANITENSADVASHYTLACLLATQERFMEAMDEFLEVIRRNRSYKNDGARKAMLALFAIIGEDQEITQTYRRKLANALF